MAVDLVGGFNDLTGGVGSGIDFGLIITIFALIVLFAVIGGIAAFVIASQMQFKVKVRVFERVAGKFRPTRSDKAKRMIIGQGGDEILYLKKHKKMLPMPTIQATQNTYWFFISDDGEWINFELGDFDDDRRAMGASFLDKEMRYARAGLQLMAKERYDKRGFMEKYGGMIAYAVLILVTSVGFWLLIGEMIDVSQASTGAINAAKEVLAETGRILGSLDTIKGGSGIRPV